MAERHVMLVPSTRTQLGRPSFHVAAPAVWNALLLRTSSLTIRQSWTVQGWVENHLFTQAWTPLRTSVEESILYINIIFIFSTNMLYHAIEVGNVSHRAGENANIMQ